MTLLGIVGTLAITATYGDIKFGARPLSSFKKDKKPLQFQERTIFWIYDSALYHFCLE